MTFLIDVLEILMKKICSMCKGRNSVDEMNYNALKNKQDFNDDFFNNNFKEVD